MTIRTATENDVEKIFQLASKTNEFKVSEEIPFYEYDEVLSWVRDQSSNILLVALTNDSDIKAFLFCKIMSIHWALLDNFYVVPEFRYSILAAQIMNKLKEKLKEHKLKYLSILVKSNREDIIKICSKAGFKQQDTYLWFDTFLEK